MTYDKEVVKQAVSLRELFLHDGHELKKSGADYSCRCPFHEEKTSSCIVHDQQGYYKCFGCGAGGDCFNYWMVTRSVDFKEALESLASFAGIIAPLELGTVKPLAPLPEPQEQLAPAMNAESHGKWLMAAENLATDEEEIARIAAWRGYSEQTVRWAAQNRLMGLMPYMGAMREVFLIERPETVANEPGEATEAGESNEGSGIDTDFNAAEQGMMIPVGYHIRLGPRTPGNDHPKKASWRYPWTGIGSWPFVMGNVRTAKILFCLEGQWDALALLDVMGWNHSEPGKPAIPKEVAIVGMRGATSWKRFVKHYLWRPDATVFAIADADNAGRDWFKPGAFIEQLQEGGAGGSGCRRCKRVWGYWPNLEGAKDFNDIWKCRAITKEVLVQALKTKLKRDPVRKKITFLRWCQVEARKRADLIGMAAFLVVRDKERPKGRKPLKVWRRHWERKADKEHVPLLLQAWGEWAKS